LSWEEEFLINGELEIFDLLGNLIYRKKLDGIENQILVNTTSFPKGAYLVRLSDENIVVNRVVLGQ